MMQNLQRQIDYSIALLREYKDKALEMQDYGYHLAFSGGKDSQVIHELAKMAGVKFQAFFNKTSVDPPEILKFIKDNYPDVIWIRPEMTMFQLIETKKFLPWPNSRYCCRALKETSGFNSIVITGITNHESDKRKKRPEFEKDHNNKHNKYFLHPIKKWTKDNVFTFLAMRGIQISDLYAIQDRIGCIGCPMNNKQMRKDFHNRPNFKKAYINTIQKVMDKYGKYSDFDSAEDVIDWWASGKRADEYLAMKKQYKIKF